jgi:hypothetical protein
MGNKRTRPRPQRLMMAKHWIPTYGGTKIVKGYRKKFAVDVLTAIRDLQELGIQFEPDYISAVEASEKNRILQLQKKKQEHLVQQHELEEQYEDMGIWDDMYDRDTSDAINIMDNHRVNFESRIGFIKKAGKNHVRVNGTLLQTNKKWSHLKQKQREWIYETTRSVHKDYLEKNNRLPMKAGKKSLIDVIVSKTDERGIWLPSYELVSGIGMYIDRLNRKANLNDGLFFE